MALQNVTGARCTICGKVNPAGPETTVCPQCGGMLFRKKGKPMLVCHDKKCGYRRETEEPIQEGEEQ